MRGEGAEAEVIQRLFEVAVAREGFNNKAGMSLSTGQFRNPCGEQLSLVYKAEAQPLAPDSVRSLQSQQEFQPLRARRFLSQSRASSGCSRVKQDALGRSPRAYLLLNPSGASSMAWSPLRNGHPLELCRCEHPRH